MAEKKDRHYWNSTIKIKPKKKKKRIVFHNLVTDATYSHRFNKWGRPVVLPLKRLVDKADTIFSLWIRNREPYCVLCGKKLGLTCGHCFKRGKKSIRWNEINCHTLCDGCNKLDNQEHDHYVLWIIDNYGVDAYQRLYVQSLEKPSSSWIREKALWVIKTYRLP